MQQRVKLKFKDNLPLHLEHLLVSKYGFEINARLHGVYIIMSRPHPKAKLKDGDQTGLTEEEQGKWVAKIEDIADKYIDHDLHRTSLRARLYNLAQGQPERDREFILKYMNQEFPLVDAKVKIA